MEFVAQTRSVQALPCQRQGLKLKRCRPFAYFPIMSSPGQREKSNYVGITSKMASSILHHLMLQSVVDNTSAVRGDIADVMSDISAMKPGIFTVKRTILFCSDMDMRCSRLEEETKNTRALQTQRKQARPTPKK